MRDADRDKFQILALAVPALTDCDQVARLVREAARENLQEHRVQCELLLPPAEASAQEDAFAETAQHLAGLADRLEALEQKLSALRFYLRAVLLVLAVMVALGVVMLAAQVRPGAMHGGTCDFLV